MDMYKGEPYTKDQDLAIRSLRRVLLPLVGELKFEGLEKESGIIQAAFDGIRARHIMLTPKEGEGLKRIDCDGVGDNDGFFELNPGSK